MEITDISILSIYNVVRGRGVNNKCDSIIGLVTLVSRQRRRTIIFNDF